MYPSDLKDRARARAISIEIHAGFGQMRELLSFNIRNNFEDFDLSPAMENIRRVKTIWTEALTKSKGPFLFGDFSIADAMYAPVVGRFKSYGVPVDGLVKIYCESIMNLPAMKEWYESAMKEDFVITRNENPEFIKKAELNFAKSVLWPTHPQQYTKEYHFAAWAHYEHGRLRPDSAACLRPIQPTDFV